jgi:hypothetical protein
MASNLVMKGFSTEGDKVISLQQLKYRNLYKPLYILITFVILSITPQLLASAYLCSSVLKFSSSSLHLLENSATLQNPFLFENKYVSQELETAILEISELTPLEKAQLNLQDHRNPTSTAMTAIDYLLLGLYDKTSWLKFIRSEFSQPQFNYQLWWNRGFLFDSMPSELLQEIKILTESYLNEANTKQRAKKANRILTFLRLYLTRPELALQKGLEERFDLNQLLERYFSQASQQPSHYKNSTAINYKQFGKLTYTLGVFFNKPEYHKTHPLVYWFGSIPNGMGRSESDLDFASEYNMSLKQESDFKNHITTTQDTIKIAPEDNITMHAISYSKETLMLASPINIAFKKGITYLVIREVVPPQQKLIAFDPSISLFSKNHIKLVHYPVIVDEAGNWSYDTQTPIWIKD